MKWLLLAVAVLLAGCGAQELLADATQESPPRAQHFVVRASLGLVPVHVLKFSPRDFELRLLFPPEGTVLSGVAEMPGCADALACFNASFFTQEGRPLGLLVSRGVQHQNPRRGTWHSFVVDKQGGAHLLSVEELGNFALPLEFGLQSGPLLIKGGKTRSDVKWTLARRTALGLDEDGNVLLLVATLPLSLQELARVASQALKARDLLNLDGGSSTQLLWDGDSPVRIDGDPVAVGGALFPRKSP